MDRATCDPLLEEAAEKAGLGQLRRRLPPDFDAIMWIDPGHVAVKYNSTSSRPHVLYSKADDSKQPLTKPHRDSSLVRMSLLFSKKMY